MRLPSRDLSSLGDNRNCGRWQVIKLTPTNDILGNLKLNPGKVFTGQIFERVWNEKAYEANTGHGNIL